MGDLQGQDSVRPQDAGEAGGEIEQIRSLATTRSAQPYRTAISIAVSVLKTPVWVGMPSSLAPAAEAGSIPSTGMPAAWKWRSRVPSLEPISITSESSFSRSRLRRSSPCRRV